MNIKTSLVNEEFVKQTVLFKCLAHPVRLAILEILRETDECVCHIVAVLGFRQVYISQQLQALRKAGILSCRRQGPNIYYNIVNKEILSVIDAMNKLLNAKINLDVDTKSCHCPKCR